MIRRVNRPWVGFCVNGLFGIYTGVLGAYGRSWWHVALAAYYIVLSAARLAVLRSLKKESPDADAFVARLIGVMCVFLAVTMAGVTYLSFSDEHGHRFHEIVMISIALYTFTKITLAIIRLVQCSGSVRPALKCLRTLALADAAVSIFALQRSMLVSFAGMSPENISLMNALTGTAVYLLTAVLGCNLIGGKQVTMAKSKIVQANRKIAKAVTNGYKKIETGVVDGYTKIEDTFFDQFLTRDGETVEDARKRLKGKSEE